MLYVMCICVLIFLFFKQKTADEMRISDWSSDVCSSDLIDAGIGVLTFQFTEIAAKGSGSNVSLLIGNPTNAAITDMTIWASWGPLNADGNPDYSKAASGELKIKGEIPGGRWSSHKVMIDGTKPDSLGFIAITGVLVGQIELFNAPA